MPLGAGRGQCARASDRRAKPQCHRRHPIPDNYRIRIEHIRGPCLAGVTVCGIRSVVVAIQEDISNSDKKRLYKFKSEKIHGATE